MWKRIIKHSLLTVIGIAIRIPLMASEISIQNESYANMQVQIYTIQSPININKVVIWEGKFDSKGYIHAEIPLKETIKAYIDLGIYQFLFYLDKDQNYTLKLPLFKKQSNNFKNSIYFKRQPYQVGFEKLQHKDSNIAIGEVEYVYRTKCQKYGQQLFYQHSKSRLKKIVASIDSLDDPNNKYLHTFIELKKRELTASVYGYNSLQIVKENLSTLPYEYTHDQYIQYFNTVLNNDLYKLALSTDQKKLFNAINNGNINTIRESLKSCGITNQLIDPYILKGIKDALYSNSFKKKTLLQLINMMTHSENHHTSKDAKDILTNYHEQISKIIKVSPEEVQIDNLHASTIEAPRTKYQYWAFIDLQNGNAKQEIDQLNNLAHNLGKILNVSIVTTKENRTDSLFNNFHGTLIIDHNKTTNLKKKCRVVATPTFVLLNKKFKVVKNNALRPNRGFQEYFLKYYREEYIKEQRSKYRNAQ
ncbi:hypothetical protein K4L44_01190 [Halosquirtibacter laminarini]|uniref:Uncharacterized protein n=1 Tax=Halosquirtibacter laminarini TaxID=3374600 RepID=A0AC61NR41_9BACT|nr:hypothetical protein K4L44_01190 [Prolixibacteraceae bacterium]